LGSVSIVVVDDFEPWRRSIISILEKDSMLKIIGEASDGLQAVQVCGELRPDLVVLDVGLPKLNGFEAAKQIREVSPDSKILFMSANTAPEIMREGMRLGAAGYVLKAHVLCDLLPAVKAAMANEEFLRFTILPGPESAEE
jgi:DNA-binding NarL/FixJ family response regulator